MYDFTPKNDDNGELKLRLQVMPPLWPGEDGNTPPTCVLYVLDPEPLLFTTTAGYFTYKYSYSKPQMNGKKYARTAEHHMQQCAIVGVGHHPSTYGVDPEAEKPGINTMPLQLRMRHFSFSKGGFMKALYEEVVPFVEKKLGMSPGYLPAARRALLGSSL